MVLLCSLTLAELCSDVDYWQKYKFLTSQALEMACLCCLRLSRRSLFSLCSGFCCRCQSGCEHPCPGPCGVAGQMLHDIRCLGNVQRGACPSALEKASGRDWCFPGAGALWQMKEGWSMTWTVPLCPYATFSSATRLFKIHHCNILLPPLCRAGHLQGPQRSLLKVKLLKFTEMPFLGSAGLKTVYNSCLRL